MNRIIRAAALLGVLIAGPVAAQDPQPSDWERLQTSPAYQMGCRMGRMGMEVPAIPRRFVNRDQSDATLDQLGGWTLCKAIAALPKDASDEQKAAAIKGAEAELKRYGVIYQEAVRRGYLYPARRS